MIERRQIEKKLKYLDEASTEHVAGDATAIQEFVAEILSLPVDQIALKEELNVEVGRHRYNHRKNLLTVSLEIPGYQGIQIVKLSSFLDSVDNQEKYHLSAEDVIREVKAKLANLSESSTEEV